MFRKVLVANRGEIACRVIATARRMGVATVAIYSDADARALHVQQADEAYCVGAAPARASYLRQDAILDAARRSGAQAVHPGYGFLSENADFAQACGETGLVWIGPPPDAIRAMGSKSAAKALMEQSGVPLVPGYHGEDQADALLAQEAARIGYPVLIKASAGGGGRGMRVVECEEDFIEALGRARGEAQAAFGDQRMLVEKYLTRPRHIEVQVFGDTHGEIVSLFERDCSVQRRHQKVLEEAPAPFVTDEQRRALGDAAVSAARAVGYVGAGTVEFIHEHDKFYFMEMNTRLQVEHPVTEFVTGLDLVEWQLRVASGESLAPMRAHLALRGHAIEARICAEDPAQDFRPATGRIVALRQPPATAHVRIDTGIREGDEVTPYYDSMLAKLIVWGEDRADALRRMGQALDAYALAGPQTNLGLLRRIVIHPAFQAGGVDTGFIPRHPDLLAPDAPPAPAIWAAAALSALGAGMAEAARDPWACLDGWRLNAPAQADVTLDHAGTRADIRVEGQPDGRWRVGVPGAAVHARFVGDGETAVLDADGALWRVQLLRAPGRVSVLHAGRADTFTIIDALAPPADETASDALLVAPTPARVAGVFVQAGDRVRRGQKLLTLEAMKVETSFVAPRDGVVEAVHIAQDELLQEGARLVTFAE